MIFKIVCRKDGGQLGKYLLSSKNEQVQIVELRGAVLGTPTALNLIAALKDFDELGKMTRGEKTLVHVAINPNDLDRMTEKGWQHAVNKVEKALGLVDQPRVVVSHLFEGKEHRHVVFSRVDIDRGVCIGLSHSKRKIVQAAREVEQELGLKVTRDKETAPGQLKPKQEQINAEKHQSERSQISRQDRHAVVARAWHQSQDAEQFKERIETAGYKLAQGNRGIVLMDENMEPHSIARSVAGLKQADVQAKLSELKYMPTVDQMRKPAKAVLSHNRARKLTREQLRHQISNDVPLKRKEIDRGLEP
jgi:hypothetical protein